MPLFHKWKSFPVESFDTQNTPCYSTNRYKIATDQVGTVDTPIRWTKGVIPLRLALRTDH